MLLSLSNTRSKKSVEKKLEQLQQQITQVHTSLQHIETALQQLTQQMSTDSSNETAVVKSKKTPQKIKYNNIYERNTYINFKQQPMYERVAASEALVDILATYAMQVDKIFTNITIPASDDWSFEKPDPSTPQLVADIIVLCTNKLSQKIALVIKCIEANDAQEQLERFEHTEQLDLLDQYLMSMFSGFAIAYGLAFHARVLPAQYAESENNYLRLSVSSDEQGRVITEIGRSGALHKMRTYVGENASAQQVYDVALFYKGVHFEMLEKMIRKQGAKMLHSKVRVFIKRAGKVAVFDALLHARNDFAQSNMIFVVKIVSQLRLLSVYRFSEQVHFYKRELQKQFVLKNPLFKKKRIVPVIIYTEKGQPYIFDTIEQHKILAIHHDLSKEGVLVAPEMISRFF